MIDCDTLTPTTCHYADNGEMTAMLDDAYMFFELGFVKQCKEFADVTAKLDTKADDLKQVKIMKAAMAKQCPLPQK